MLAQVHSFLLQGIDPLTCEVEVDVQSTGLPKTTIVGLADAAVKEAIERVRAAMTNSGYPFPISRMLVSLAPADLRKEGNLYDLPMAVGFLLTQSVLQTQLHKRLMFAGELALDGRLRPVNGIINLALLAKRMKMQGVVVPEENAEEAAVVEGIEVYPASTLSAVVAHLNEVNPIEPIGHRDVNALLHTAMPAIDFADVRGQEAVKRALTIAAAGNHNVIMIGPAGTGKSMLAKSLPGILPPLSPDEALEVTRIYSSVGLVPEGEPLITQRPVRSPHHTSSAVAVIGGGTVPRPGEVSLAHHGILFLDEMPEFPRTVLETLRQPLEDGNVTIARAHASLKFPAQFMLVAAMNPTPKGTNAQPGDQVSQRQMDRYLSKLSQPLIDRVDIHIEVPRVDYKQLSGERTGETSATIREKVLAARDIQTQRNGGSLYPNARLSGKQLDEFAQLDDAGQQIMKQAMTSLGLSARAYDKIRRVARTIADLDGFTNIRPQAVAEAIQYRLLDRDV